MPSSRRWGASVATRCRSRASGSAAAEGGPMRKSSREGTRSTVPTISPSRTKRRLLPVSTAGRYSCTITCREPRAVADSTSDRALRSSARSSHTSMPENPSTGLSTAVPCRSDELQHPVDVGADQGVGAQVGEAQHPELLLHRPYAAGPVDHVHAGVGSHVEQVRRPQVARVHRRVQPQQRDPDLVGDVDHPASRARRTRGCRPASGGRRGESADAARSGELAPTAVRRRARGPPVRTPTPRRLSRRWRPSARRCCRWRRPGPRAGR